MQHLFDKAFRIKISTYVEFMKDFRNELETMTTRNNFQKMIKREKLCKTLFDLTVNVRARLITFFTHSALNHFKRCCGSKSFT